eukprot:gnl/Spiro4/12864_TR6816_c0_g1_i1.p1 gnl/Spiro4/12864_TR6816_c0_g1~~gnl/Spiro4/12864_TR6816_c0_g1_i1.p1  ORF type:complete len:211 (-),score=17.40 gnl/Spiro4/12864_TR6816_c0_g1_i1:16-612(-)
MVLLSLELCGDSRLAIVAVCGFFFANAFFTLSYCVVSWRGLPLRVPPLVRLLIPIFWLLCGLDMTAVGSFLWLKCGALPVLTLGLYVLSWLLALCHHWLFFNRNFLGFAAIAGVVGFLESIALVSSAFVQAGAVSGGLLVAYAIWWLYIAVLTVVRFRTPYVAPGTGLLDSEISASALSLNSYASLSSGLVHILPPRV